MEQLTVEAKCGRKGFCSDHCPLLYHIINVTHDNGMKDCYIQMISPP